MLLPEKFFEFPFGFELLKSSFVFVIQFTNLIKQFGYTGRGLSKKNVGHCSSILFFQMLNPLSRHLLATVHLKNAHAECYLSSLDHSSGAFSHN